MGRGGAGCRERAGAGAGCVRAGPVRPWPYEAVALWGWSPGHGRARDTARPRGDEATPQPPSPFENSHSSTHRHALMLQLNNRSAGVGSCGANARPVLRE